MSLNTPSAYKQQLDAELEASEIKYFTDEENLAIIQELNEGMEDFLLDLKNRMHITRDELDIVLRS